MLLSMCCLCFNQTMFALSARTGVIGLATVSLSSGAKRAEPLQPWEPRQFMCLQKDGSQREKK